MLGCYCEVCRSPYFTGQACLPRIALLHEPLVMHSSCWSEDTGFMSTTGCHRHRTTAACCRTCTRRIAASPMSLARSRSPAARSRPANYRPRPGPPPAPPLTLPEPSALAEICLHFGCHMASRCFQTLSLGLLAVLTVRALWELALACAPTVAEPSPPAKPGCTDCAHPLRELRLACPLIAFQVECAGRTLAWGHTAD